MSPAIAAGGAQTAVAPAAAEVTAQGMATAAYPGVAGGTSAAGAVGPMSSAGAAGGAEMGLLGTAASYAAPVGVGLLGGTLGQKYLDPILPGGGKTGKAVGGVAGGAIAGAAIGSIVPGVGTIVGGIIGGVVGGLSSLF